MRGRALGGLAVVALAGTAAVLPSGGATAQTAPTVCQTTAFVGSAGEDVVDLIDVPTGVVSPNRISVPQSSLVNELATTPDGSTLLVVQSGLDRVSVVNVATRAIVATIPVGDDPQDVAVTPDGTTAFVTNFAANSVSTINIATRTKDPVDIVGFERPTGIAISADGSTAFVANFGANYVSTVAVASRTIAPTGITVGLHPFDVGLTPDGTRVYVVNLDSSNVTPIVVASRTALANITVNGGPSGVAFTPCAVPPPTTTTTTAPSSTTTSSVRAVVVTPRFTG